MKQNINNQEAAVENYLAGEGIEYSATYRGETTCDNGWVCDEWQVTFKSPRGVLTEKYYTGTGHRQRHEKMPADIARLGPRILARVEWEKRHPARPVTPAPAGVLHCLLMDSHLGELPFDYFCDELGLSTDSRKALADYESCCSIRAKMNSFFSRGQREKLETMLENY